jgi:hypothetical protein
LSIALLIGRAAAAVPRGFTDELGRNQLRTAGHRQQDRSDLKYAFSNVIAALICLVSLVMSALMTTQ